MHFRRLASLALGAWLAGSLLVGFMKTESNRSADRFILAPPREASRILSRFPEAEVRAVLRYHAFETNRLLTGRWALIQLALGAAVLAGLFFGPAARKPPVVMCVLMLAAVAFLRWFLTPEMDGLARTAAFADAPQQMAAEDRLRSLETGYSTVEWVKLGIGLLMTWTLLRQSRRSRRSKAALQPALE